MKLPTVRPVRSPQTRPSRPGDTIVAIVMAASGAECFINEFAEVASVDHEASEALRAMADAVLDVEANKGPLELNFLVASSALTGTMFDKGAQSWQDFAALVRLRNLLFAWPMHNL